MIVQLKLCPAHGRRETAMLTDGGRRRCDAPVIGGLCGLVLTLDDGERDGPFDRELLLVRQDWPETATGGPR
jgi:hypothetical protein